jgi:hypothetical protein
MQGRTNRQLLNLKAPSYIIGSSKGTPAWPVPRQAACVIIAAMCAALAILLALAAAPAPAPPASPKAATVDVPPARNEVVIGRYHLKRRDDGRYEAKTEAFTALITSDGAVTFEAPKRLPGPAVWPILVAVEAVREATSAKKSTPDPRGGASARPSLTRPTLTVSDEDLRKDPHHAAKMTFLETTAPFRESLQKANDKSALAAFESRVRDAARDPRRSPDQRRSDLFDLWLDCDEGPRGAPARTVVETVAARTFPAGAKNGYSPEELARFNARAPTGLRFSPYAPEGPKPAPAPAVR